MNSPSTIYALTIACQLLITHWICLGIEPSFFISSLSTALWQLKICILAISQNTRSMSNFLIKASKSLFPQQLLTRTYLQNLIAAEEWPPSTIAETGFNQEILTTWLNCATHGRPLHFGMAKIRMSGIFLFGLKLEDALTCTEFQQVKRPYKVYKVYIL